MGERPNLTTNIEFGRKLVSSQDVSYVIVRDCGVFVSDNALKSVVAQLICYADVLVRQSKNHELDPLSSREINELINLNLGVDSLLDFIEDYFPEASYQPDEAASAYVYAIGTDKSLGRVAYVKLFAGRLHARDVLYNNRLEADEKIALIKKGYGFKFETVSQIESGDIAMLTGLKQVRVGDILGAHSSLIPEHVRMHSPLLTVQAIPAEEKNYAALANALLQLSDEDPSLDFEWDKEERTLQLKIYGEIQTQILASMLENRFGIEASFTDPAVVYKETNKNK